MLPSAASMACGLHLEFVGLHFRASLQSAIWVPGHQTAILLYGISARANPSMNWSLRVYE